MQREQGNQTDEEQEEPADAQEGKKRSRNTHGSSGMAQCKEIRSSNRQGRRPMSQTEDSMNSGGEFSTPLPQSTEQTDSPSESWYVVTQYDKKGKKGDKQLRYKGPTQRDKTAQLQQKSKNSKKDAEPHATQAESTSESSQEEVKSQQATSDQKADKAHRRKRPRLNESRQEQEVEQGNRPMHHMPQQMETPPSQEGDTNEQSPFPLQTTSQTTTLPCQQGPTMSHTDNAATERPNQQTHTKYPL